ncbi:MAG: SRPBCC family protein [Blastocatellia bacterium]
MYARHDEAATTVPVGAAPLFDHLDDQERLAVHMEKPSMMMMGGRMFYEFDAAKGRAVGSVIRMGGNFLWLTLLVEEEVIIRDPPNRKIWETRGPSNLIVIGDYRMGFEIARTGAASRLRVFVDYNYPPNFIGGVLGALFAPMYARWCVSRMAKDAERHFAQRETARALRSAQF